MLKDEKLARKLLSVDRTEYVFIKKPEKLQELKKLEMKYGIFTKH